MTSGGRPLSDDDESTLASILAEVIERRRNGEAPEASQYTARHPHLRQEILAELETIEFLERASAVKGTPAVEEPERDIGLLISELDPLAQRLIYLRNLAGKRWAEIARELGRPEVDLRRRHARALRDLLGQRISAPESVD